MLSIRKPIAKQTGLFSIFFDIYLAATIAVVFSLVYLDIPHYVFVLDPSIEPKYFYYASAVMIAPLMLFKFRQFLLYMLSPFSLWVFAEIIIQSYDLLDANEAAYDLIMVRDNYLILAILYGFAASIARTESYQSTLRIMAIAVPVCVIIDFISPGIFNPEGLLEGFYGGGRAAAMFINPTRAGEAILLTSLLAIPFMRLQYRMFLLLLAGAAVIVTFSRGPIIAFISFWLFLLTTRNLPKYSFVFPLAVFAALPLLIAAFKSYIEERRDLDNASDNLFARLDFFQTESLSDDSAQERIKIVADGWKIFLDNPIFGAGTGITDLQSNIWPHAVNVHNQIVMVAAEHGIFGIALWAWLLVILWRGRYFEDTKFQVAAAVGIFFMSFFNHNMFDTSYWLMTFALVSGRRRV